MLIITPILVCIPLLTNGYRIFQSRIPNGDKIPHPCLNETWQGVGHESSSGGGPRNQFGMDFYKNNKVWNRLLCEADSDGDGRSNGMELGDPDCTWTPGGPDPSQTSGLSHPGICEPLNSDMCDGRSTFVNCQKFDCPATTNPDNSHFRVHFEDATVPEEETSYHCLPFAFPDDNDYYILAYEPIVNNSFVLHHVVIYGCNEIAKIDYSDLNKPYSCFMGTSRMCTDFLAVWALGMDGYCFPEGVGLKVGKSGYKRAILELPNANGSIIIRPSLGSNPMKTAGYTDSSGLDITITSVQQPNEAGVLMIGQVEMYIPPETTSYSVKGACPGYCREQYMSGDIQVFSVFNHMHYLGQSIRSSVVIPNTKEDYLAYDLIYDYNRPIIHNLNPPSTVRPGYELKLLCDFNSTGRNTTTKWGFGSFDEMCFSFLFYYPANKLSAAHCVTSGIYEQCKNPEAPSVHNGCDFDKVLDTSRLEVQDRYGKVDQLCNHYRCLTECKDYLRELFRNPCYTRENRPYLKKRFYRLTENRLENREYWSLLQSCDWELAQEEIFLTDPPKSGMETDAAGINVFNVLQTIFMFSVPILFR